MTAPPAVDNSAERQEVGAFSTFVASIAASGHVLTARERSRVQYLFLRAPAAFFKGFHRRRAAAAAVNCRERARASSSRGPLGLASETT